MLPTLLTTSAESETTALMIGDIVSVAAPLAGCVLGIFAMTLIIQRRYGHGLMMATVGAVLVFISYLMPTSDSVDSPADEVKPENTPAPTPPVTETTPEPNMNLPWELLGFTALASLFLATVVVCAIFGIRKYNSVSRNRKLNIAGWEKLIEQHHAIRKAWGAYEMDMEKIIDFPMMTDMKEPAVAKLHTALRKASHLEPSSVKVVSHVPSASSPFAEAVHELDVAFKTAESEAKKIAWNKFTTDERKHLSRAKDLLALAMDTSASASERQVAYKRVIKELEGIISFPAKAILTIESITKLELESVPS